MSAARAWLGRWLQAEPRRSDAALPLGLAVIARGGVLVWEGGRFPPVEDGRYYHVFAERISQGLGYTWLWPDGAVTSAAHYPVGYPATIGALYAVFGADPRIGMGLNAILGCLAVFAAHRIAASVASRLGALLAALIVALDPAMVAYTPALMTEGVTASLVAIAAWVVVRAGSGSPRRRFTHLALVGVLLGFATLVRPQNVLFAPVFGALVVARGRQPSARGRWPQWVLAAGFCSAAALGVTAPWTMRNCARMGECVWVSANGGWNLLIGAGPGATGGYVPLERAGIPGECLHVFDEAGKDRCFWRGAVREIQGTPWRWVSLVPRKLSATFDSCDAAGWYLHTSNPHVFDAGSKDALQAVEIVWHRCLVLLSLVALSRAPGPRRPWRLAIAVVSLPWLFLKAAWLAHLGLVVAGVMLGRSIVRHLPGALALVAVAQTAAVHVLFFGASRYALVCSTLLGALAGTAFLRPAGPPNEPS